MDFFFYATPFLSSFLFSVVFCALIIRFFRGSSAFSVRTEDRHIHRETLSRFGGLSLISAFLLTVALDRNVVLTYSWWGIILASSIILLFGLWDDVREISWKVQMAVQVFVAGIAVTFGIRMMSIPNPFGETIFLDAGYLAFLGAMLTVLWIIVVMNAINWADGIDGLSGGLAFIGFMTIFFLSLRPEVNQPPVAILSLALAGSSLGFLSFNAYPARIFAGTSGAWFLGFMLATLAVFSGTKIATTLSVLALPILDAVWVVFDRIRSGVSVFAPDRRHLHHRLLEKGWSARRIDTFFYGIAVSLAFIALHTGAVGKLYTLFFFLVSASGFFVWIRYYRR